MRARARWLPFLVLAAGALPVPVGAARANEPVPFVSMDDGVLTAQAQPLRLQYHLDEGGSSGDGVGTTPESSGNNLSTAVRFATPVAGRFGNAFQFGPSSRMFTESPLLRLQSVTVMAWVKAPSTPGPLRNVMAQGGGGCEPAAYALYTGSSSGPHAGGLHFYVYDGAVAAAPGVPASAIWDGAWHMVAGTFDGATARLYVDGLEVGAGQAAGPIQYSQSVSNFTVGSYADPDSCAFTTAFSGAIDEARVYSGAAGAAAIARMAGDPGPGPPVLQPDETPPQLPPPPADPTPAPAPAPAPAPVARNLTEPRIDYAGQSAGLAQYRCFAGTWAGLPAGTAFASSWWRTGEKLVFNKNTGALGPVNEKVGTAATFTLPRADLGRQYYCQVQVVAPSGRTLSAYSPTTVLTGPSFRVAIPIEVSLRAFGDVGVRGIDVFQVVQPLSGANQFGFPSGDYPNWCGGGTPTNYLFTFGGTCALSGRDPARATYGGVGLDQRKPTTAVVYVDTTGVLADPALQLDVSLTARVAGKQVGKRIVKKLANPPISNTPYVPLPERNGVTAPGYTPSAVRFDVPTSWLAVAALNSAGLDLDATVSIPTGAGSGEGLYVQCLGAAAAACGADDRFRLDGIGPVADDFREVTFKSLALVNGKQALNDPDVVLKSVVDLFPGGAQTNIPPFSGVIDIADAVDLRLDDGPCLPFIDLKRDLLAMLRSCRMAAVERKLDEWWLQDARNRQGYDVLVGIHDYLSDGISAEPGWMRGGPPLGTTGHKPTMALNAGGSLSAAHEYGHALGFPHADRASPDPVTKDKCGGNADGQVAEEWRYDNTGRLQGIAWDPVAGPHADVDTKLGAVFDLMSYCSDGNRNRWLSPFNWNRAFSLLRAAPAQVASQAAVAQAGQSSVSGVVGAAGAQLGRVVSGAPGLADPSSSLRLRTLDAGGDLLGDTGVLVETLADGPGVGSFTAALPAGATALELVSGGTVVDTLARTQPPTVSITAPARGARVRRSLITRWTAADPDGGELQATVDLSRDGGRTWQGVFQGPSTGAATIPGAYLAASHRARLRVTVSDGFDETSATSALFRVDGAPPRARIVVPGEAQTLQTGRILLAGTGLDDRGRSLRGKALTWFAGSRRLGRGKRLSARLPAGNVRLRLVARDGRGRKSTVTRAVRITPVALQLTALDVPARVRAGGRILAIRVATSVRATIRASGARHRAGTRARTVRIRLPTAPRTGLLKVPVTIEARGARQTPLRMTLSVLRV